MGAMFKQWVDRYAFRVETKHGGQVIRPLRFVITSNWSPDQIWTDEKILAPILRRFHIHEFTEQVNETLMPKPERIKRKADFLIEEYLPTRTPPPIPPVVKRQEEKTCDQIESEALFDMSLDLSFLDNELTDPRTEDLFSFANNFTL